MAARLLSLLFLFLSVSCTSLRLASLDPFPAGVVLTGPEGSYEVVPPTESWVRLEANESQPNVDLALARKSKDAWLNVNVVRGRYATMDAAFERVRSRAEAMMNVVSRNQQDLAVLSPGGEIPARLGEYCGSFDRELRSRDNCFVILVSQFGNVSYALVGQVRLNGTERIKDELATFAKSLRITKPR